MPDELRTTDLPNTSKSVYKQNNKQSEYVAWKPSRKVGVRPMDKAVAGLLGRGRQVYLPLTGPSDIWKPKKDVNVPYSQMSSNKRMSRSPLNNK